MFNKERTNKGFTMIELVMVIVVLAILAVVAIPQFQNLTSNANTSAEAGVVGGVRAGIAALYVANLANSVTPAYPTALDSVDSSGAVSCASGSVCFSSVLGQGGIITGWAKNNLTYTGPNSGTYTYNSATGVFQ